MAEGKELVRRITHYSSDDEILLVGQGDFSFSLSLALAFGSASNIVATSLDTHDELKRKYSRAESNVAELTRLGAQVLHGVDATQLMLGKLTDHKYFDRIIFNFPHSGSPSFRNEHSPDIIKSHKQLMRAFFRNAAQMVRPRPLGQVHVSHKTTYPFRDWNIVELARASSSLILLDQVEFRQEDYPGYCNKRGDGEDADQPFPLGTCSTFKFSLKTE